MTDDTRPLAAPVPDDGASAPWGRYFNEAYYLTKGREAGLSMPQVPLPEQIQAEREKLQQWARSAVQRQVLESLEVSSEDIIAQREKVNDVREQMPTKEQWVLDAEKGLDEALADQALVGSAEPRPPSPWRFLLPASLLGLLFGLVGATTIATVLRAILRLPDAEPAFYIRWAVALGVLIGLVVANVTPFIQRYAYGAARFVRWAAPLAGACFALGLAGFRMIQSDPETPGVVHFYVTPVAIVLLFCEMGILVFIEMVNQVSANAWEQYHQRWERFRRADERVRVANEALAKARHWYEDSKARVTREDSLLKDLNGRLRDHKHARENVDLLVEHAVQATLRGFDLGRRERGQQNR